MNTVVVTGAAQGVGLADRIFSPGAKHRVILLDLQPLDAQVERLRAGGADAHGFSGDVSSETFIGEVAARIGVMSAQPTRW